MATRKQLTFSDRLLLEEQYEQGMPIPDLAQKLDRHKVSIYRELRRGYTGELNAGGRPGYSADIAQRFVDIGKMHADQARRKSMSKAAESSNPKNSPES